jgi:glycerol-1-phosphate dehydrogenase [NAD(P)+]
LSAPSEPTVVIGEAVLAELAEFAQRERWRQVLVVMDANTEEAAGREVAEVLRARGLGVRELVFAQRSGLHPGRPEVARVEERIDDQVTPLAVGSGVITDIVRYAAHSQRRDFVCVATAASMDGYASTLAALQCDGVKVTLPARAPRAVFADPRVIAAAPPELTRAGAGDLLAKASARVDWLASHLLCGEPFSAPAAALVDPPLSFALANATAIAAGDPAAVGELMHGLLQSGRAISVAGSSRPASGCEHHASHFWDLLAARGLREHGSHGLQVGYATRFALQLQRFAYGGGVASLRAPSPPSDPLGPAAREWLGSPSPEVVAAVAEKGGFIEDTRELWPGDEAGWASVRDGIAPALAVAERVAPALDALGLPSGPGFLEIDEPTLRATFRFASRLRARYTTIDFLEGQGALGRAIDAMLDRDPGR